MKEKNKFFYGIILGIILTITLNSLVTNSSLLYRKFISKNLTKEQKIDEIQSIVDDYYIEEYNKEAMNNGIYKAMVASLDDPYSYYMSKNEFEDYISSTEGNYVGIGIMVNITEDEKMNINKIFEGSPAKEAGLKIDDKIMMVDDINISLDTYNEAISSIKGEEGSKVKLSIYRKSEDKTFDIYVERKRIEVPTVSYKTVDNNIGYISITEFDGVTYDQFKLAFDALADTKGLIIDLRNNPGGYLNIVNKITDMLVPEGTITYLEDKNGKREYHYSDKNYYNKPLAILVNGNSASASEVLSGAVKDFGVGKLVGENTFGKGIVQNMYTLTDGSGVKVTIAKYYTPNGICIHKKGIKPDYEIKNENENIDSQLDKAIEVINSWKSDK